MLRSGSSNEKTFKLFIKLSYICTFLRKLRIFEVVSVRIQTINFQSCLLKEAATPASPAAPMFSSVCSVAVFALAVVAVAVLPLHVAVAIVLAFNNIDNK